MGLDTRMDALSAIAGSVSSRQGGEMTLGLASAQDASSAPPSRTSASSSPRASPGAAPIALGAPSPMYSQPMYSPRQASPRRGGSVHQDDLPRRAYSPRNASPVGAEPHLSRDSLRLRDDHPQRDPSPENRGSESVAAVASDWQTISSWAPLLIEVKELPKKGNTKSFLCSEMREVLNQADRMLVEYSREKTKFLADGIYSKNMDAVTKIDENKTTLGIVVTDDTVETVLPGGPAFHAGLRKGDRILKVGAHTRIAIVRSSAVTSV